MNRGIDVDLANKNGVTLLMLAATVGNTVIGKLLIQHGANLDERTHSSQSDSRFTALAYAVLAGKPLFTKLLMESGASLDASPFQCSFESYIDWAETYSAVTPEQAAHIRTAYEAEKQKRAVQISPGTG